MTNNALVISIVIDLVVFMSIKVLHYPQAVVYPLKERSAWNNGIILEVPPTPLPSARAASESAEYGIIYHDNGPWDGIDEELLRLRALAVDRSVDVGPASTESTTALTAEWVESIGSNSANINDINTIISALSHNEKLIPALAGLDSIGDLTSTIQRWQQHAGLDRLEQVAGERTSTKEQLYEVLAHEWWVFGGRLVPLVAHETILDLNILCVPLVRYDSAIHVILVEQAFVADLVFRDADGCYQISPVVHAALDRARFLIDELERRHLAPGVGPAGIRYSRAFVTVVVGDPRYVDPEGVPTADVREHLRRLNTFLAGMDVITYEELISIARQLLDRTAPKLARVGTASGWR